MGWGCDCECALYLQKGTGMEYREDRKGQRLSILGYGCMRFTKNGSAVDLDKAEQELMYAIRHGVNYLDTAYVYAGNEEAVGTILERNYCRRDIFLATKLPHYLIKSRAGAQKKFEEELRRLRTDYIDFYLMHMLNDVKTWESLVRIGIADWIAEEKVSGEIRSIGFSYHGNSENFRALLDAYDWDFCQIQYNYLDEHSQAGREGLEYAAKKGIPVIIMARWEARTAPSADGKGTDRIIRSVSDTGRDGAQMAVGSAGCDLRALRYEFDGDGTGKYPDSGRIPCEHAHGRAPDADRAGKSRDSKIYESTVYRMCLLYAMPAACRHSDGISLLQRKIF